MKKKAGSLQTIAPIEERIREIRGHRFLLDFDLAAIYGVTTAALNQAVQRNADRFPDDFAFRLNRGEIERLISQNVISKAARGGRTKPPRAFTEHGALQAANVLRSQRAVQMSVFVIRAFVKMREAFLGTRALASKLQELEKQLTSRLDQHDAAIVGILQQIMKIITPSRVRVARKPQIGFHS